jgi:hypothetical protein
MTPTEKLVRRPAATVHHITSTSAREVVRSVAAVHRCHQPLAVIIVAAATPTVYIVTAAAALKYLRAATAPVHRR